MRYKSMTALVLLVAGWLWPVSPQALAGQNTTAAVESEKYKAQDEKNRRFFTDLKVRTHEGEELRFYSDILKDKLVVISFFYTDCPTAQPALLTFFKLQKRLEERLGRDVLLLTLSVDPENDTPEAVGEYAKKFNPQEGWLFLTGSEKNMEVINRRLGNTLRLPEGHLRLFLLGNLKTGHWMRMLESAPVIALSEGLRKLASEE
ncbi:MAG: SCO family protein [Desulfobacterales bacterium]|nr:MAG: SCO family protein [Desulfobacterales bacterium]